MVHMVIEVARYMFWHLQDETAYCVQDVIMNMDVLHAGHTRSLLNI
jgi:hypothetical protein